MTSTQLADLKARLYADASLAGLTNDQVATILSTPVISISQPCMYTDKMLVRDLDTTTALTLLDIVATIAASNNAEATLFRRINGWLVDGTGIDLGLPKTRAIIDTFVTASLLTADQAAAVKALAEVTSYPQGGPCTSDDVATALASNAADALATQLRNTVGTKANTAKQRLVEYQVAVASGQTPTAPTIDTIWA